MNYFKENLRNRRIIVGMSQNDLAEKMHVSRQTISNWELGKNEPNLDDLIRLSEILEISVGDLLKRNSTLFEKISRKRKDNTIIIGSTRNIFDFELVKSLIEFDKLNLGISFDVITASAATLNYYLNKGDLDILIDYYTQINLDNRRLKTDIIGNFKTCFACNSKLYEDYKSCFKSLKNMKQFEFVLPSIASRRRQALDIFLNKDEIKLKEKHSMPDSIGMANFIEHTNYIGYFLEDELKFSNLKKINIPEDLPVNSFVAIYSNDANKYVKLFVNILKNCSRY